MTKGEKEIGKTKVGLIICAVLVAMLAVSNVWYFTRVEDLQNQVGTLEMEKDALQSQLTGVQSEFMALNASYVRLDADYSEISLRFEELSVNYSNLTKIFGLLQEDYAALSKNYSSLLRSYDLLAGSYDALRANYSTLLSTYQTLQEQYFALNDLYETLLELWDEPLEYVVTPTWDEVIAWLETDQTDAITYDPDKFLCGDFSIMLIQHAKAMNWRMLFTVLEFDYYEDNPTGIERHHGDNAHAFVSIFTTEGIVYIEPQTDFTWNVHPTGDNETHVEFSDWVFMDFEGEWFGHIFVQYYNRCAGADVEPIETSSRSTRVEIPYQLSKN